MAGFLKVLFRNLLEGPSTDPFPLGETFTPARLRGRGHQYHPSAGRQRLHHHHLAELLLPVRLLPPLLPHRGHEHQHGLALGPSGKGKI